METKELLRNKNKQKAVKSERKNTKNTYDQGKLEEAILRYQAAIKSNDTAEINKIYQDICEIYPPLSFVRTWFKKYRYLYDTREDFIQDYLRIFCTSLAAWQPRHLRPESRYNGTGDFKNFFWSSLSHNYINQVKSDASGKRNLSSKCPICSAWCNPLSTHLLKCHAELLWDQLESFGHPLETLSNCPFCKSHKVPRNVSCEHQAEGNCAGCLKEAGQKALKRHLLSMHSTYLFERFRDLYPEHVTLSSKPDTIYARKGDNDGEEMDLYDFIPDDSRINRLLSHDLTPVQVKIIYKVFNGSSNVNYDPELYKCSSEEFYNEFEGLKNIMTLCDLGG